MPPRSKQNMTAEEEYEIAREARDDLAVRLADALIAGNTERASDLLAPYRAASEDLRLCSPAEL